MSDWDTVTIIRGKNAVRGPGAAKSNQAVNAARRRGEAVSTEDKFGGGGNKQHGTQLNTMKLDQETEELKHNKVPVEVGKLIQKGRQAKNLTQKDLATKINEKPQVVMEFESGKALPNQAVLAKMERTLELKLRGKEKGQPLVLKPKAK